MTKEQKEAFVEEFRRRAAEADAIYLTDFTGLDVKAMTSLRQEIRKSGGEYLVVKNRLVKRALEGTELPDLSEHLLGPTGVVFGDDIIVEPAKAIADFAKDNDDKPVFKAGIVESGYLDAGEIQKLAMLPSREVLMAQIVGALEGPMAALATALQAKVQEVAGLLGALKNEKG